ncbi:MAG TPA: uracil-DNA glycosylase family protein [Acidimicrobiales bacterium]|nr:uracil-DNA glycosylase family protein [Acidimicrobiales bacterium]
MPDAIQPASGHPVEEFRADLATLLESAYPPGVVPIREYIRGTAFFSGGPGLYMEHPEGPLPPFPFGGLMFIGHNFDAEEPYLERLRTGKAHGDRRRPMKTWRGLYRLLELASVNPCECFFTNIYVGLIAGAKPTGKFPGAADPDFVSWCTSFLERQMAKMEPRGVVMLGAEVRNFFKASQGVGQMTWRGHELPYAALVHPSMHPANAARVGGVTAEAERLASL